MPYRPRPRSSTTRVLAVVVLAVATPISADGICSRTGPIRDAILGKLPDIDHPEEEGRDEALARASQP